MRWYWSIPSFLILLIFGLELCSMSPGTAGVNPSAHLAFVQDDDDTEGKLDGLRDHCVTGGDPFILEDMNWMAQCGKTVLEMSLEEAGGWKVCPGVRRHRWLCKECC